MSWPTRWTWVWVNSRSWWWTGRPGMLRFMGSQRVGHDWATEMNWTELIQVIHVHPYPINIVSDSLHSVFILGNIETSIINSNQPIIQQLFLELQSLIRDHTSPIYIIHIRTHSCFSGPVTHGNKQANKLVSFATPKEQHALLHNNVGPLHQIFKIPYHHAKEIINNCSTCRPPTSSIHCTRC